MRSRLIPSQRTNHESHVDHDHLDRRERLAQTPTLLFRTESAVARSVIESLREENTGPSCEICGVPFVDTYRHMCIAAVVANIAVDRELATRPRPDDVLIWIKSSMCEPSYQRHVKIWTWPSILNS